MREVYNVDISRATEQSTDSNDISIHTPVTSSAASQSVKARLSQSSLPINTTEKVDEPPKSTNSPPQPSVKLLFSQVSKRDAFLCLIPAIAISMISGGISPFMTLVVGQTFDAFAKFPLSGATNSDRSALKHSVGIAAIELIALSFGSFILSSLTSALWVRTGERNVMRLRQKVYAAVTQRDMEWFDTKMGSEESVADTTGNGSVGAGGLMAKFARDTDDVRMASSLASGMTLQYLTTCLACLALALSRSWALTLVILSAVPALVVIQAMSQRFAGPLVGTEREQQSVAATLVERAFTAIATVKAFNAQSTEVSSLSKVLDAMLASSTKVHGVWGLTSALSQFTSMAMFVQGFWFGSSLVRKGTISPGDVMAVFWACLIATSNLQMCIPQLIIIAKGKFAIASLLTLINPSPPPPPATSTSSVRDHSTYSHLTLAQPTSAKHKAFGRQTNAGPQNIRKITPLRCLGDFSLDEITFAYPSRPDIPVLRNVSLYFPSNETTFVVGGSGSGKSTIAQLLARLYVPQTGTLTLDDQDVAYIDEIWLRAHVAVVSQSCILFEGTVHDNVALGVAGLERRPEDVTRQEVIEACTAALMHEFVRDLPNGYDTMLGQGGASLSGGQKQRLAIARAILRNPTVLVLDEATSALDATSRVLVFEAIKTWRKNKTTIVITHDLSQITSNDFVYVLRDGYVVEQGYRVDLEVLPDNDDAYEGEFRKMMRSQGETGGFPIKEPEVIEIPQIRAEAERILEASNVQSEETAEIDSRRVSELPLRSKHQSLGFSSWMLDVVQDLSRSRAPTPSLLPTSNPKKPEVKHLSTLSINPARSKTLSVQQPFASKSKGSKRISADLFSSKNVRDDVKRHLSLQFTPSSPEFSTRAFVPGMEDDDEFYDEKTRDAIERTGELASKRRLERRLNRTKWTDVNLELERVGSKLPSISEEQTGKAQKEISFVRLVRDVYPTVPRKSFILLGMIVAALSGAMTPLFSFLLSKLLFEVSIGATNTRAINMYGGIVLAVAAGDGLFMGLKFFIMETGAMNWVTSLRKSCYSLLLAQDKKFFDKSENSPVRLMQILIKDGDDARGLIATVLSQCIVVITMVGVGLIWAMVVGWQLTLAGIAIGPVFAVAMTMQANLVARCERRNKEAREEVAKGYYESIINIRAIRCMSFENVFRKQFEEAVDKAHSTGVQGAFVEGCTYGIASGLIYLAEALLFYVGAVLIAQGTYSYLQMVEVLNLVVFSVTIGSQLMAFTQRIAKATQATRDFNRILQLDENTDESRGSEKPLLDGDIEFNNVEFSYPERADVPVLQKTSLLLRANECVAIVGASGSGKSTVASLLQRLYEPSGGLITVGGSDLGTVDVKYLREHVAVVSQNPNLFNASVSENIAYGNSSLSTDEIEAAARAANVHEFIVGLPKGYDTLVGENASQISGGQAQRLQIARALARPSNILILDECTSALDPANQAIVMDTIRSAKVGRTTLIVTHKLPVMQMCDRIIVVHEGAVAETGTFEDLIMRNGVFSQLARGGEWSGE